MERASLRSRVRRLDASVPDPLDELEGTVAPRAYLDDVHPFVASGAVAHVSANGPERFRKAREGAQRILSGLELDADGDLPPGVGPRLVGGFGFEDQAPGAPWDGFPALRFWLPARQLHYTPDGVFEVVTERTDGQEEAMEHGVPGPTASESASCLDRPAWDAAVERVLNAIGDGSASKVVLARTLRVAPADPVVALRALHRVEPTAVHFLLDAGPTAFYGATPERLAVRDGDRVETHALAGSAPAGEEAGAALVRSPKDILEHELVTTYIRGRLEALGARQVHQERRRIQVLRHVQHLETPIAARSDAHLLHVAAALHPTPAVCGLPPRASLALIRRLEPAPRGWYSGAVGWFDARGHGRLHVALRSALSTPDATWLHAGAGIVADSDAASEWAETEHKLRSLEAALAEVAA